MTAKAAEPTEATKPNVAPEPIPVTPPKSVKTETAAKSVAPKTASDPKEFEATVQEVRSLEQRADFSRASELCASLQTKFDDHPEFAETIYDLSKRVSVEKAQADSVGFAVSSLAEPNCAEIAAQAFHEAGDTGRLLLHHAYRTCGDDMKLTILKQLQAMNDERVAELLSELLVSNPAEPLRQTYVGMLRPTLQRVPGKALPALFGIVKREPDKNKDLALCLFAVARRAGADQPADFEKLFGDSGAFEFFRNLNLLSSVCSEGLAVCFNFDEKIGTTAANAAMQGKTADVKATWVPGKKDGAIKFNGIDEMLTYNDPSLALGKGDFTLAFWLYLEKGANGSWRNITHKGFADDQRTFAIWMKPEADVLHCRITTLDNGNDGIDATTKTIPLNAWTHVAYVRKANALKIYIDGQKDSEIVINSRVLSNSGPIYIGKDPWYPGAPCGIDDYRIYTRALTDGEIRLLAGLPYP
jgi:hypothetical protein